MQTQKKHKSPPRYKALYTEAIRRYTELAHEYTSTQIELRTLREELAALQEEREAQIINSANKTGDVLKNLVAIAQKQKKAATAPKKEES